MRVLADPDILTIELNDQHALRSADMQHDPPVAPRGRHLERALVEPGRVVLRNLRWEALERHLHVRVLGMVVEALHRPEPGDLRLSPVGGWLGVWAAEQLEAPGAVEREP